MRIGIVNDVLLAREALRRVVVSVPDLQVAWTAADGAEAIDKTKADKPDIVLMDLFMPKMDGVEATKRIMEASPCAVLVVTATVQGHMHKVYEAMGYGALDAIDTPTLGPSGELKGAVALLAKIALIGRLIGGPRKAMKEPTPLPVAPARPRSNLVLIGASTGGPNAVRQILGELPKNSDLCAIIVQHVDVSFAAGLATWLGDQSKLPVELIQEGQSITPGKVLLAGTNDHLIVTPRLQLSYTPQPAEAYYRPSVDVFFNSVADHWTKPGVAVLLTGMGRDGAEGLLRLKLQGWHTIAQDQHTCAVWGMPRAAVECQAAVEVLPVQQIAAAIASRMASAVEGGRPPSRHS